MIVVTTPKDSVELAGTVESISDPLIVVLA